MAAIPNPIKTPVENILVDDTTGEILYYTPHCRPKHVDNPRLYTNVQPVFKWNKERTELVKVGERDVDKEIQACAVGVTPYELFGAHSIARCSGVQENNWFL